MISVVMPMYNAERYVRAAVQSIQSQTFTNFEFIIIDDGSTDRSRQIVEELASSDPRIHLVSRANTGIVRALNEGLALARGEFVARMDADDWSFPSRFESQLQFLASNQECVCVGSSVILIDGKGTPVDSYNRHTSPAEVEGALLKGDGGAMVHPAVFIRKRHLDKVGGYRAAAQYVEDLDLFLRLSRIGWLTNLPDVLLYYRVHGSSINFTKNRDRKIVWLNVLNEAYAARGLTLEPQSLGTVAEFDRPMSFYHQRWAVTSLAFGKRSVALRHGVLACLRAPKEKASWKSLSFALRTSASRPAQSLPNVNATPLGRHKKTSHVLT